MSSKDEPTELQSALLSVLLNTPRKKNVRTGVDIPVIYESVYGDPGGLSVRDQQQKLGSLIARTNNRLQRKGKKYRIVPGRMKQTYCIQYNK